MIRYRWRCKYVTQGNDSRDDECCGSVGRFWYKDKERAIQSGKSHEYTCRYNGKTTIELYTGV